MLMLDILLLYTQVLKSLAFRLYSLFLSFIWPDSEVFLMMQTFDGLHASTVNIVGTIQNFVRVVAIDKYFIGMSQQVM